MSFDPNLPAPNSPLASAVMRAQFNGLKALIDAVQSLTPRRWMGQRRCPAALLPRLP